MCVSENLSASKRSAMMDLVVAVNMKRSFPILSVDGGLDPS